MASPINPRNSMNYKQFPVAQKQKAGAGPAFSQQNGIAGSGIRARSR